ncbi:MAG: DUF3108 domain-containing protein [Candidatus Cloacimonetes bacterium]|jgi:hypothetical protein|nr:DUF3108 domain-containing protein [Candidatus Cloacimonadota bacterium]MBT5419570.1 DUF3108 domain-containing protein [Candidatus Cloacimonadota bacterium]
MNQKYKVITFLLLLTPILLLAETFDLSIKYLGITAVKVSIVNKDSVLTINAKATPIASIASNMDNFYKSVYSGNFLPIQYQKLINQGDYYEDRIIKYNRDMHTAKRISNISPDRNCEYPINLESRDFFSALFYLRKALDEQSGELWVDANRLIWKVNYKVIGKETISTKLGEIQAIKVELNFQNYSNKEKERSDMLTNNLVNPERALIFWFSDDDQRLPLKAKFMMKPFAVVWKLNSYKK